MKFFKNQLTGKDNETFDVVRVQAFLGGLMALALVAYGVLVKGQPFDLANFGLGFGGMLAGIGAALKLKETTEPGHELESK